MNSFNNFFLKIQIINKTNLLYDSQLTKDIEYILKKLNFKKPIFCDVGAYKGIWISKYLKKLPNLVAYLIEPHEKSYLYLTRKV